ncbi:MAG: hypothetical protein JWQ11_3306 [Rhizobacter sp.]|nr:hypothetical protein [Rhizobacter sp.]
MRKLFRFWMTGGVAVVLAALGARAMAMDTRPGVSRASRYGMIETMQRIEASAARHGLAVFARSHAVAQADGRMAYVIVLESIEGGTPVLMEGPHAAPDLPLSLTVRQGAGGLAEVVIEASDWEDLPHQVTRDLASLPGLVDEAVG